MNREYGQTWVRYHRSARLSSAGDGPTGSDVPPCLADKVDLAAEAKRKRKQHHWSKLNRVQPSSRLIATSNNSTQQC